MWADQNAALEICQEMILSMVKRSLVTLLMCNNVSSYFYLTQISDDWVGLSWALPITAQPKLWQRLQETKQNCNG